MTPAENTIQHNEESQTDEEEEEQQNGDREADCGEGGTHAAAQVALDQPLSQQLGPEAATELHQLLQGQTGSQRLVLLHHGPAGVLQDQQTHVPDRQQSSQLFTTRRSSRPGDGSAGGEKRRDKQLTC